MATCIRSKSKRKEMHLDAKTAKSVKMHWKIDVFLISRVSGFYTLCPRNVRGGLLTAFELHPDGVRCRRWCYGHERRREEVENNVKIQPNLCLLVSKWLCILLVTKSCAVYTFSIYSLLPPPSSTKQHHLPFSMPSTTSSSSSSS